MSGLDSTIAAGLASIALVWSGWLIRGWVARGQPGWRVECAGCLTHRAIGGAAAVASDDAGTVVTPRVVGPRRQMYVELWDSYGQLYEKWAVGQGEQLNTQEVGPWLLEQLRGLVHRVNAYQAGALPRPHRRKGET